MRLLHPKSAKCTVLGSSGWIGSALVNHLRAQDISVNAVDRERLSSWLSESDPQGHVFYAIGLTADFRHRPFDTIQAHVSLLGDVLQRPGIETFVYLSSTRVYARSNIAQESAMLPCLSSDSSDLYNLSKLLGEALVLQDPRIGLKVVRLSNVVGYGQPQSTFLGALLKQYNACGAVTIEQPIDTVKNYVSLDEVVRLLPLIAERGQERVYNLGSCVNTSHAEVACWLERHGARVRFDPYGASRPSISFPPLVIDRLSSEFPPPSDPFSQTNPQQFI